MTVLGSSSTSQQSRRPTSQNATAVGEHSTGIHLRSTYCSATSWTSRSWPAMLTHQHEWRPEAFGVTTQRHRYLVVVDELRRQRLAPPSMPAIGFAAERPIRFAQRFGIERADRPLRPGQSLGGRLA